MLGCLRDSIPKLTRSSLHRCLERYGISRLPISPDQASERGKFAQTAIGYVHIDISELRLAEGKLNMFLAIDRVSKFTYVEFRDDAEKMNGAEFLRGTVEAFPYAIHTVLTDNGMAFADLPKNRNGSTRRYLGTHIFDRVCNEHGIEHKLAKPYHPGRTEDWSDLDQWPSRAHKPHRQGSHHQGVPLPRPRKPQSPRPGSRVGP